METCLLCEDGNCGLCIKKKNAPSGFTRYVKKFWEMITSDDSSNYAIYVVNNNNDHHRHNSSNITGRPHYYSDILGKTYN